VKILNVTGEIGLGSEVIPIDLTGSLYKTTLAVDCSNGQSVDRSQTRSDRCTCNCHKPDSCTASPLPPRLERSVAGSVQGRGCEVCREIEERKSSASRSQSRQEPKSILKKRCDYLRSADAGLESTLPKEFQSFNLLNRESDYTLRDAFSSVDRRLEERKADRSRLAKSYQRDEALDFRSPPPPLREKSSSNETARFNPEDQIYDWSEIGLTRTLDDKDALAGLPPQPLPAGDCVEGSGSILEEVIKVQQECDRLEGMLTGTRDRISVLRAEGSKPSHNGGIVRFPLNRPPKDKPFFSPATSPQENHKPLPPANTRTLDAFRTTGTVNRNLAADSKTPSNGPQKLDSHPRHNPLKPHSTLLRSHQSDSKQQQASAASHSQQPSRHFLSETRRTLEAGRPDTHFTSDFSDRQLRAASQARRDQQPPPPCTQQTRNRSFNGDSKDSKDWDFERTSPTHSRPADRPAFVRRAAPETSLGPRVDPCPELPARPGHPLSEEDHLLRQLIAEKNSVKRRVLHTLAGIPSMERRLDHCAQLVDHMRDEQLKSLLTRL